MTYGGIVNPMILTLLAPDPARSIAGGESIYFITRNHEPISAFVAESGLTTPPGPIPLDPYLVGVTLGLEEWDPGG